MLYTALCNDLLLVCMLLQALCQFQVHPVLVTYDATSHNGNAAIVGFVSSAWSNKSEATRRDAVLRDLARYFGPEALHYVDYVDKKWSEEPFTGGCPCATLPTGNMENYMTIREPTGRYSLRRKINVKSWQGSERQSFQSL